MDKILVKLTVKELRELATKYQISGRSQFKIKNDLVNGIVDWLQGHPNDKSNFFTNYTGVQVSSPRPIAPSILPPVSSPKPISPLPIAPSTLPPVSSPKPIAPASPQPPVAKEVSSKTKKGVQLYIYRVLQQIHPNFRITKEALDKIDTIIRCLIGSISKETDAYTVPEIRKAINKISPGELMKHAVARGMEAVTKYENKFPDVFEEVNTPNFLMKENKKYLDEYGFSSMADLQFSVRYIDSLWPKDRPSLINFYGEEIIHNSDENIEATDAAIYVTSVIEYIVAEILEISGNIAQSENKITITPKFIEASISKDPELLTLFSKC